MADKRKREITKTPVVAEALAGRRKNEKGELLDKINMIHRIYCY